MIILVWVLAMAFITDRLWFSLGFTACELLKLDFFMRYVYLNSVQSEFPFLSRARAHIEYSVGL